MAWLEGPDPTSFSVRVAASDPDSGWTDVSIVAPPARGSQTGLVATVLESGEWLLAWSAFDGKDDEILWSVGSQDNWTAPRRLDRNNSVPDIMPAIVTTRGGALLTWSRRIEGEYRVMSARFNGSSWSLDQKLMAEDAEPGSTRIAPSPLV